MKTILEILQDIRPEYDFQTSADYLSDGLLDSLDLITLVSDLDKTYEISIEGIEIIPENFQNLQTIQALLTKYGVTL